MEITGTGDGGVSAEVPVARNVLEVPSDVDRLYEVIDFVKESLGGLGVSERAMAQIELVVEEIYVNIASYAYPPDAPGELQVTLRHAEGTLSLTFADRGTPYDPLTAPPPDLSLPLAERAPGGLGLFIVRKTMDAVDYRRDGDRNVLTLSKRLTP